MNENRELPDFFDSLAAICKFIVVPKAEPDFHNRHYHAIEMANSFIRVLAGHHPPAKERIPRVIAIVHYRWVRTYPGGDANTWS